MKKLILILVALMVITMAVVAEEAPEVTYGFSGSFDMDVVTANKSDTFKTGDFEEPVAKGNPYGLEATNFVVSPWVELDWAKVNMMAEATYDAFNANDDDWSSFTLTTVWKDFFGLTITDEFAIDNEDEGDVDLYEVSMDENVDHTVTVALDRLEDQGVKLYAEYDAGVFFDFFDVTAGDNFADLFEGFNEMGFELDTEGLGAALVVDPTGTFTNAWIEARDMFGVWTMLVNDDDEMELRMENLDLDVSEDREDVGIDIAIGEDNNITDDSADGTPGMMNVMHTLGLGDALTLKIASIIPYDTSVITGTFLDWLAEDNLVVSAEYMLEGLGSVGAGAVVTKDYIQMFPGALFIEGPSTVNSTFAAATPQYSEVGPSFWVDAYLDELVDGLNLMVSLDADFDKYVDLKKANEDIADGKGAAADDHLVLSMVGATVFNVGAEAEMGLSDALTVSGALYASLGMGLDYEKYNNVKFDDVFTDAFFDVNVGEWDEADALRSVYGTTPTIVNLRADYMMSEKVSFWAQNDLDLNSGYLNEAGAYDFTDLEIAGSKELAGITVGYFNVDTIEVGAKLMASENVTLSLSTAVNMYLGLPAAKDFYLDAATDDEKKAIDSAYGAWKVENFNPYSVSAEFSFSY